MRAGRRLPDSLLKLSDSEILINGMSKGLITKGR